MTSGCFQEFETPSAFEDEMFLCGTAAFDERVEACRERFAADGSCGGVVSLQGRPQATDVVTTVDFTTSIFRLEGGGTPVLAQTEGTGVSPYFLLSLKIKNIGGEAPEQPVDVTRTLAFDPGSGTRPDPLGDEFADVGLRISNGAESVDLAGLRETGAVTITRQGAGELAGTLEGSFGEVDDTVEGCFHFFALDVRVTQ